MCTFLTSVRWRSKESNSFEFNSINLSFSVPFSLVVVRFNRRIPSRRSDSLSEDNASCKNNFKREQKAVATDDKKKKVY